LNQGTTPQTDFYQPPSDLKNDSYQRQFYSLSRKGRPEFTFLLKKTLPKKEHFKQCPVRKVNIRVCLSNAPLSAFCKVSNTNNAVFIQPRVAADEL